VQGEVYPLPTLRSQRLRKICGPAGNVVGFGWREAEKFGPPSPRRAGAGGVARAGAPHHFSET